MISIKIYVLWIALLTSFLCFAEASSTLPYTNWKVGDKWEVATTLYARDWMLSFGNPIAEEKKNIPKVLSSYIVTVEITDILLKKDIECWQIDFIPSDEAPIGVREQNYRVWISKNDGSICGIKRLAGKNIGNPELCDIDGVSVLINSPYGFPLDVIPWGFPNDIVKEQNNKTLDQLHPLSASRKETMSGNKCQVELNVQKGEQEILHVSQKWGQKNWWLEYEKFSHGHKELYAKLQVPLDK